jgi:hypothetical protein
MQISTHNKWIRKCPKCRKRLKYSYRSGLCRALKNKSLCKSCKTKIRANNPKEKTRLSFIAKNRIISNETRKKLSALFVGKNNPMYGKSGHLNPFYGKHHSQETKKKLGELSIKVNTGRKHSTETIKLWRKLAIERKKKLGIYDNKPFYNPIACKFIDTYNKQNGYNFQHAENGGEYYIEELNYWLDGYDKGKNTIFEYNEPHHYDINGNLREKDIRRLNEIKKLLICKVIIYNGKSKSIEIL